MAKITGFTAARMLAMEAATVVSGVVTGDNLILKTKNGTTFNAGNVRGPQGAQGPVGSISASPAGGDLSGNYPNPTIGTGKVTSAHILDGTIVDGDVAAANKDGVATKASMRTLGPNAQQAAAGNHTHDYAAANHTHAGLTDSGWVDFTATAGTAPFASAATLRAQYRKVGSLVHVRISKAMTAARDVSASTNGNFANVDVLGDGSLPAEARPGIASHGQGRIDDSDAGLAVLPTGGVVWYGGLPRAYVSGAILNADFVYFTDS